MSSKTGEEGRALSLAEYQALAEFRHQLRRFLSFSEQVLHGARLLPQQFMLLLALMGLPAFLIPTIGTVAERLQLRHHSAVGLVTRMEAKGLLRRRRNRKDRRQVLLELTEQGKDILRKVAPPHYARLRALAPDFMRVVRDMSAGETRLVKGAGHPASGHKAVTP